MLFLKLQAKLLPSLPLPLLFFILLMHQQQFQCYGNWLTRAAAAAAAAASVMPSKSMQSKITSAITTSPTSLPPLSLTPLIVSSSEATLLTIDQSHFPINAAGIDVAENTLDHVADADGNDMMAMNNEIEISAENVVVPSSSHDNINNNTAGNGGGGDDEDIGGYGSELTKNARYKIVAVHTNCTRDLFEISIGLNRQFRGLLYAKDFPLECRARGTSQRNVTLRLSTAGCGVRVEPRLRGNMELTVRVMLQMEQKLRQSSDILRTIRCKLPATAMGMAVMTPATVYNNDKNEIDNKFRNGRMSTFNKNAKIMNDDNKIDPHSLSTLEELEEESLLRTTTTTLKDVPNEMLLATSITTIKSSFDGKASYVPIVSRNIQSSSTPRVRIWLELGGLDGSGAVEVGQATTLTVRAIVPGTMGVRVTDCAALDGLGDSTQQLLDERGCPIDEQVMPELHTRFKPAEEGWSKHNEDDLVEKTFTATFPAFKFPDRERLHVSCGVQLCKGKCPNINCKTGEKLILSSEKNLARIEVFNSLAVTAPQIEVDRLHYDRRFNISAEFPPNIRSIPNEGTLCLSVSKLALSFCILGSIFLVAIIVAICSLIRSRRRYTCSGDCGDSSSGAGILTTTGSGSCLHRAEVCTSMFSSSSESAQSARFGSKLFMPYYPNTLPYGRVY